MQISLPLMIQKTVSDLLRPSNHDFDQFSFHRTIKRWKWKGRGIQLTEFAWTSFLAWSFIKTASMSLHKHFTSPWNSLLSSQVFPEHFCLGLKNWPSSTSHLCSPPQSTEMQHKRRPRMPRLMDPKLHYNKYKWRKLCLFSLSPNEYKKAKLA